MRAVVLFVLALVSRPCDGASARGVTSRFERPPASRDYYASLDSVRSGRALTETTRSSRAHLTPIGRGAVAVTWTTREALTSGTELEFADAGGRKRRAAIKSASWTEQLCLGSPNGFNPKMGPKPAIDAEALATIANTSSWADADASNYRVVGSFEDVVPSAFWSSAPCDKSACLDYSNPDAMYQSPIVHTAVLTGLKADERYSYSTPGGVGTKRTFKAPKAPKRGGRETTKIAVVGDTGQTEVTREVLTHVKEQLGDSEVLVHTGDLSYADGFAPRWDSFEAMSEFVLSEMPMLTVPGNHDVAQNGMELVSYLSRYPSPYVASKSPSQLFWSYEVGQAHIIGLNSYANTEVGIFDGADSPQIAWLKQDLATINREYTPWVIVVFHVPWYNSNHAHFKEAERTRKALERILFDAGVDLILNGHVHSYERSHPVLNYDTQQCGPVHIVVGDGGNYEGPYGHGWIEPQPLYSAFREGSFGAGSLVIHDETRATWELRRTTCVENTTSNESYFVKTGNAQTCRSIPDISAQAMEPVDSIELRRDTDACPNKMVGSAARSSASESPYTPRAASTASLYSAIVLLIILWVATTVALIRSLKMIRDMKARMYRSPALLSEGEFDDQFEASDDSAIALKNFARSENLNI